MVSNYTRHSYHDGVVAIRQLQRQFHRPPKREVIDAEVKRIVREVGLRKSNQERYFVLWATCAMLGLDALCQYWKVRNAERKSNRRSQR